VFRSHLKPSEADFLYCSVLLPLLISTPLAYCAWPRNSAHLYTYTARTMYHRNHMSRDRYTASPLARWLLLRNALGTDLQKARNVIATQQSNLRAGCCLATVSARTYRNHLPTQLFPLFCDVTAHAAYQRSANGPQKTLLLYCWPRLCCGRRVDASQYNWLALLLKSEPWTDVLQRLYIELFRQRCREANLCAVDQPDLTAGASNC
jgi:hypothetical protein